MRISVTGVSSRQAVQIEAAANLYANQLLHPRTVKNLELDIEVEEELDVHGECISEDMHRNPRYFTIRLRKKSLNDMLRTLAHEMVHVKQYAKNELSERCTPAARGKLKITAVWKGELWVPSKMQDAYWDSPWEQEAYGMECSLYYKWTTRNDSTKPWCVKKD